MNMYDTINSHPLIDQIYEKSLIIQRLRCNMDAKISLYPAQRANIF